MDRHKGCANESSRPAQGSCPTALLTADSQHHPFGSFKFFDDHSPDSLSQGRVLTNPEYKRASERSGFANPISTLLIRSSKNGNCSIMSCSSCSCSAPRLQSARGKPYANHAGSTWRLCIQPNPRNGPRSSSPPRSPRLVGRNRSGMLQFLTGVASIKIDQNPDCRQCER